MKITDEQMFELVTESQKSMRQSNWTLRKGQALMNSLYDINRCVAQTIIGTEFDPFYDNSIIPKFFSYLNS